MYSQQLSNLNNSTFINTLTHVQLRTKTYVRVMLLTFWNVPIAAAYSEQLFIFSIEMEYKNNILSRVDVILRALV